MRTWCHLLAAVLALAGHLAGVVGLPLPTPPKPATPPQAAAKPVRTCHCACGGGCGPCCCCCSGDNEPADQPTSPAESELHWLGSVQLQKCFGIGPAAFADLPPGLPVVRTYHDCHADPAFDAVTLSAAIAAVIPTSPPTPPPRLV
jgi:hypothetical protein